MQNIREIEFVKMCKREGRKVKIQVEEMVKARTRLWG